MKKVSCIILFILFSFACDAGEPNRYVFAQQVNNVCRLLPMLNLGIVDLLEQRDFYLTQMNSYSRREWFVFTQRPFISFDFHGSVFSFHQEMLEIQTKFLNDRNEELYGKDKLDTKLVEKLGVVVVDSIFSKEIESPFKIKG